MEARDKDLRLIVEQDECPESPREEDNLGTMVCWHRYDLGDKHDFKTPEDFQEYLKEIKGECVILPIYMYDHSGIGLSTNNSQYPYNCPWEAGQVGWIYCTKEKIKKEFGKVTTATIDKAVEILQGEVETYHQFVSGDVYSFSLDKISKCKECGQEVVENICSYGGFYGHNFDKNGMSEELGLYAYLLDRLA